ncbi:MAG: hypothetical protein RQ859_02925 [Pyrobaculum sp.]|jgi:hypothetical protein|nr:hypothetical protein [Pyrobaculum sp.]MDT7874314.1 hypothetical protein [Pyrobaculum sp.]
MRFKDFLNSLDDPLKFYLQYSLKRLGLTLDNVEEEEAMHVVAEAAGPHIAEVLYEMYLEVKQGKKKLVAVSA